jgi:hypothetical protein
MAAKLTQYANGVPDACISPAQGRTALRNVGTLTPGARPGCGMIFTAFRSEQAF